MNKPEILSDDRINAILYPVWRNKGVEPSYRDIAEAQRDADVEWFREDSKQLALECHKSANRRVEQARREVAESIFADLYELLEGYHPGYVALRLFVSKLAELKAKYLGK